ncbi:putative glycoside hydrolase [Heterostelium album PN500]|uniref:cellulase n=1 Tax=Heterostelium pallidum (strain ATCC 26659 / Pp 5 / PN500) TaxID=670386 RepID=D3BH17_HETP5|nr:putative glycoside hydrolase [Heterostelium album PN500]EFA79401.1 putative glycoside hydrolase [Heterostelium album PN500]|eukprot:XP_020431522.1 putative glycoside hydrolase [Heterostelium album PN500]
MNISKHIHIIGSIATLLLLTSVVYSISSESYRSHHRIHIKQTHNYCEVMNNGLMFYKYNRAGRLSDNDVPWRGPSVLKDASPNSTPNANGDGDLSKGYFDAGDGVKFALPMAASMTILGWGYLEYNETIENCNGKQIWLEDLQWGYDWLMAAHYAENRFAGQVGEGNADHAFWGPPEMITMDRPVYILSDTAPGTEVAMEASAALSICYMIFKDINVTYAERCLQHAQDLWTFGDTYRGVYSDSIPDAQDFYKSWSGYKDEIVWGSIWLYRATGDKEKLARAVSDYAAFGIGEMAQANSHDWDLKAPGVSLLMSQLFPDNETYRNDIEQFLNWWLPKGGVPYTPGGMAWIRMWGPARYTATTSFLMSVYGRLTNTQKYTDFTASQINYLLGDNPNRQSFVVGYGPNHPINPHHRASHHSLTNNINNPVNNTYLLLGALVGGPGVDDSYVDNRLDYVKNEVACDYQAGFLGAVAYLSSTN